MSAFEALYLLQKIVAGSKYFQGRLSLIFTSNCQSTGEKQCVIAIYGFWQALENEAR